MALTAVDSFRSEIMEKIRAGDAQAMSVIIVSMLILVVPFDLSQLIFMLVGAVAYMLLQATRVPFERQGLPLKKKMSETEEPRLSSGPFERKATPPRRGAPPPAAKHVASKVPRLLERHKACEYKQPSSQPVQRPTFQATGWDDEVRELLGRITPTRESDSTVQRLVAEVRKVLSRTAPEAEVFGFASSELTRAAAFAVAVPEVDIIVNLDPVAMANRLHWRNAARTPIFDARKLQKSVLRLFTDQLVSDGRFKFRRSAFRGAEPKVTLLASEALGAGQPIPIDFSVNCTTPLYNAALLMECGQIDSRAKELVLFVKRWAKDRGVAHAAKGHLSPYAWTLLTIYFLQVGLPGSSGLLPQLGSLRRASAIASGAALGGGPAAKPSEEPHRHEMNEAFATLSVGDLFKQFVRFYANRFDWQKEAVSIRSGKRSAPGLALPLHIVLCDDGVTSDVAPSIEDPFEAGRNLAEAMTAVTLKRLREEFSRAEDMFVRSEGGSLSLAELLEPWSPPEREAAAEEAQHDSGSS